MKARMLSGIQPTNKITLGNYLGAIKQYVKNQDLYENFVFVADLHAITNDFNPLELHTNRQEIVCTYYACGLDFTKCCIFYQSAINSHTDLAHILLCHTNLGELNRMTQFKDKAIVKAQNNTTLIKTGLLTYPVLMAADILLYDADFVIVGADQKQHMELTRDIAQRMNKKYQQNLFTIPKDLIFKTGQRIMDLQNPLVKMSKSSKDAKGTIFLSDGYEEIKNKILKAKTDCLNKVNYDLQNQPGITNLINIYQCLSDLSYEQIVAKYQNITNYAIFKKDLVELIWKEIEPIQHKLIEARNNYSQEIQPLLAQNASKCNKIVQSKTNLIHQIIGLHYDK